MYRNIVAIRDTMTPVENTQAAMELPREKKHLTQLLGRIRNVFHKKQRVCCTFDRAGDVLVPSLTSKDCRVRAAGWRFHRTRNEFEEEERD